MSVLSRFNAAFQILSICKLKFNLLSIMSTNTSTEKTI